METLIREMIRVAPSAGVALIVAFWFMSRNEKRLDANAAAINKMASDTASAINAMGEKTSEAVTGMAEKTSAAITSSAQINAQAMVELARTLGRP